MLKQFNTLFIWCKIFCVYPYSYGAFITKQVIQKSYLGSFSIIFAFFFICGLYHILEYYTTPQTLATETKHRAFDIFECVNIVLLHLYLPQLAAIQLPHIRRHNQLNDLYKRLHTVDNALKALQLPLHDEVLPKKINLLLIIEFTFEIYVITLHACLIKDEFGLVANFICLLCLIRTINALDKSWYTITMLALRYRFAAINGKIKNFSSSRQKHKFKGKSIFNVNDHKTEFLKHEFSVEAFFTRKRIVPEIMQQQEYMKEMQLPKENMEQQLNKLCKLHDELCEICTILNDLWSFPLLMMLANNFIIFISQFYYYVCATQNQVS